MPTRPAFDALLGAWPRYGAALGTIRGSAHISPNGASLQRTLTSLSEEIASARYVSGGR